MQEEKSQAFQKKTYPRRWDKKREFYWGYASLCWEKSTEVQNISKHNHSSSNTRKQLGESTLSKDYSNYFGIKSIRETDQRVVFQTNEYIDGKLVQIPGAFRAYDNLAASMAHHGLLVGTADRYKPVVESLTYQEAAKALLCLWLLHRPKLSR